MKKFLWKSMKNGLKSAHGKTKWKIGEWQQHTGTINMCNSGFHASKRIIDAMQFVDMEILARVEVRGSHLKQNDKEVWSEMQIVKAYKWEKKDSVALSIYAAELCLANFEKVYPEDHRPRQAIEAAKKWLEEPTKKNQDAARSAAWSAARSAWSAAWSAESAARSAASAAWSAAWSAASAAWSAWSAASAELVLNKVEKWLLKRVDSLEEIL